MKSKVLIPIACTLIACSVLLVAGATIVLPTVRAVGRLLAGL